MLKVQGVVVQGDAENSWGNEGKGERGTGKGLFGWSVIESNHGTMLLQHVWPNMAALSAQQCDALFRELVPDLYRTMVPGTDRKRGF